MLSVPIKVSGGYPEKEEKFERFSVFVQGVANKFSQKMIVRQRMLSFPEKVHRAAKALESSSVDKMDDACRSIGWDLLHKQFDDNVVAKGFALIRKMADQELGQKHYDVQLMGGWCLLHGMVAEMETGEGKTLTAALAASLVAMAGIPVHVITPNDYLTQRDAESMAPLYTALGLSVGHVIHGQSSEQRRQAYRTDITYCTNKEIAFDYLRDRITTGNHPSDLQNRVRQLKGGHDTPLLLRGLHFAIVDEADSVLIDESRTPLIITRSSEEQLDNITIQHAFSIANSLVEDRDFSLVQERTHVTLSDKGKMKVLAQAKGFGAIWQNSVRREELVNQALAARYLYHRDEHYMVVQGKVQIIDQSTGRMMDGRSWGRGLQQMIEWKEACEASEQRMPQARISYQRFFRRYMHLAGMTGTAKEVSGELWSVYTLPVMRIPTHKRVQRVGFPPRVFFREDEKYAAVIERIHQMMREQRPVLVGTRCLASSEALSRALNAQKIEHKLINARQARTEAETIACAGEEGRVTIATNMAGRGTDIKLAEGIVEKGGLHVIICESHEARRIDRQLIGRCGRQGEPGSYEMILSMDDALFEPYRQKLGWQFWRVMYRFSPVFASNIAFQACRFFQQRIENEHFRTRAEVLKMDQKLGDMLAFSGHME